MLTETYANGIVNAYIDRINEGSVTGVTLTNSNSGLTIPHDALYGNYNGSMQNVRIYNRVLSAAEIQAIYNAGQ